MPKTPELEPPRIYPTMRCKDAEAMIAWLKDVIGFTEHVVYRGNGMVQHAELAFGSSILMLGQDRDNEYGKLVGLIEGRRTDAIYVSVDDPDAVCARARASGVRIEMEPYDSDHGSRDFSCRDPEGNFWAFGTFWPKVGEEPMAAGSGQ